MTTSHVVDGAVAKQIRADGGVSHAEYELLHRLSLAPDRKLRMGTLATLLLAPKSRLTYQIERLRKRGLVEREQHPSDLRGVIATLTDKGVELLEHTAPGHVEVVRRYLIDLLDEQEVRELDRICRIVAGRLAKDIDKLRA